MALKNRLLTSGVSKQMVSQKNEKLYHIDFTIRVNLRKLVELYIKVSVIV